MWGKLGSTQDPDVQLCLDLGANITLIFEECYRSLCTKPRLRQGMKLKLWALMNNVWILGYINLTVLMITQEGKVLKFEEEAYVVPGMNVPILLGEDFQVNYDVSIHQQSGTVHVLINRDGTLHQVEASNALEIEKGFEVYRIESKENDKERVRQEINVSQEDGASKEPHYVRASQDIEIKADMSCKVSLVGNFNSKMEWMVEHLTLGTKDGGFYGTAASLIKAEEPFVHVANSSSKTHYI